MPEFFATFGSNHSDDKGNSLHNNYVRLTAPGKAEARMVMFNRFGNKWSFVYSESEFKGQAEKYNLTEVPLPDAKKTP